jgi:hypothetical protein
MRVLRGGATECSKSATKCTTRKKNLSAVLQDVTQPQQNVTPVEIFDTDVAMSQNVANCRKLSHPQKIFCELRP